MSRRWQPPKPKSPQTDLFLRAGRGEFTPPVKLSTDTSREAAASIGIGPRGKEMHSAGDLAKAMIPLIEKNAASTRLGRIMFAVTVRKEVYEHLQKHRDGLTADEIADALRYSILTVRPRVSELREDNLVVDTGIRRKNASGRPAIVWRVP